MPKKKTTTGSVSRKKARWTDADDAPALKRDFFARAKLNKGGKPVRGRPRSVAPKKSVSLRLDQDVIAAFKAKGEGWQTEINASLRKAAGLKAPTKRKRG
jgi:uncharacterized protein (DUF4415 family)